MEHDIEILLQIWKELKPHLLGGDVDAAADDFMHVLLEHGIDANEIIAFGVDSHLKSALRDLADEEHFDEEELEDEWGDEHVEG